MKPVRLCTFACVVAMVGAGAAVPAPVPPAARDTPERELARLTGRWQAVSWRLAGNTVFVDDGQYQKAVTFAEAGTFAWDGGSKGKVARIDPSQKLKEIDYAFTDGAFKDKTQKAIYKLEGDTLTECFAEPGEDRPTEFQSTQENGWGLIVYKRVKKTD